MRVYAREVQLFSVLFAPGRLIPPPRGSTLLTSCRSPTRRFDFYAYTPSEKDAFASWFGFLASVVVTGALILYSTYVIYVYCTAEVSGRKHACASFRAGVCGACAAGEGPGGRTKRKGVKAAGQCRACASKHGMG